ncbi:hypothetical protein AAC389_15780 [Rhodococcus qingshengii]|uniref:hypothetical protein n=1 Tax=Rhodococcus qingshengii TaxID=334542 RepID=UPI00311CA16C
MTIKEVTYFIAVCDGCKEDADYGDFTAWGDSSSAVEMAGEDWFERMKVVKEIPPCEDHPLGQKIVETVELLCPACQKCEICGESGYQMDDHLVCGEHEDHDFTDAPILSETESWQTWDAVPDHKPYHGTTENGLLTETIWVNASGARRAHRPSGYVNEFGDYADYEMHNFAPFVAAKEG